MTIENTIRELYTQLVVQYEANPLVKMRVDIKARENGLTHETAIYVIATDYANQYYACQNFYKPVEAVVENEIPQK